MARSTTCPCSRSEATTPANTVSVDRMEAPRTRSNTTSPYVTGRSEFERAMEKGSASMESIRAEAATDALLGAIVKAGRFAS